MNEVLRQEKKLLITQDQMAFCIRRLEALMPVDPHCQDDGYLVRSLYFDSLDDQSFLENMGGEELRRKIRLRNYGPGNNFAMLETKQKQGRLQRKQSIRLGQLPAANLIAGDCSPLSLVPDPFAQECYTLMCRCLPRVVVEYRRLAFIARGHTAWVTLDHHLTATRGNFDIFSPTLPQYPILDPMLAVLEVKYNGSIPVYITDLLRDCQGSELTVSKYALCRGLML